MKQIQYEKPLTEFQKQMKDKVQLRYDILGSDFKNAIGLYFEVKWNKNGNCIRYNRKDFEISENGAYLTPYASPFLEHVMFIEEPLRGGAKAYLARKSARLDFLANFSVQYDTERQKVRIDSKANFLEHETENIHIETTIHQHSPVDFDIEFDKTYGIVVIARQSYVYPFVAITEEPIEDISTDIQKIIFDNFSAKNNTKCSIDRYTTKIIKEEPLLDVMLRPVVDAVKDQLSIFDGEEIKDNYYHKDFITVDGKALQFDGVDIGTFHRTSIEFSTSSGWLVIEKLPANVEEFINNIITMSSGPVEEKTKTIEIKQIRNLYYIKIESVLKIYEFVCSAELACLTKIKYIGDNNLYHYDFYNKDPYKSLIGSRYNQLNNGKILSSYSSFDNTQFSTSDLFIRYSTNELKFVYNRKEKKFDYFKSNFFSQFGDTLYLRGIFQIVYPLKINELDKLDV